MIPARKDIHSGLFFFGVLVALVALPLSRFLLSVSFFILIGNWLLEGNFKEKLKHLKDSKVYLAILALYLLHLLSFFTSENTEGWMHDARVKFPLFLIPFVLASTPSLSKVKWKWLILFFTAALLLKSILSFGTYCGWWGKPFSDVREITGSLSPIRFSLMLCLDILLLYFLFFRGTSIARKIPVLLTMAWFILFMLLVKNLTGIFILSVVVLFLLALYLFRSGRNKVTLGLGIITLLLILIGTFQTWNVYSTYFIPKIDTAQKDSLTARGFPYLHDSTMAMMENGYKVGDYLAWDEMNAEWPKRSKLPFYSKDHRKNDLQFTVVRFLTSKGWRKDADAISRLSDKEITAIENGIANVVYLESDPVTARIHQVMWELDGYFNQGADPNGHSVTQRIEFWKAGVHCWNKNIWIGVGTGDVGDCLKSSYTEIGSPLREEYRLRSHNQFLAIAIGTGIIGLIVFLFSLLYPFFSRQHRSILYFSFFLIMGLSMFTEDTLETQVGVTLFALFNSLFLFHFPPQKEE